MRPRKSKNRASSRAATAVVVMRLYIADGAPNSGNGNGSSGKRVRNGR